MYRQLHPSSLTWVRSGKIRDLLDHRGVLQGQDCTVAKAKEMVLVLVGADPFHQ